MQRILKEITIKNLLLIILLVLSYFSIKSFLLNSSLVSDKASAVGVLSALSIIAVIACFGNFAFTYEKVNHKRCFDRYLAHFTTGALMLIVGISLIFTDELISIIMGRFILLDLILILLYLACVGYDLWDVLRINQK